MTTIDITDQALINRVKLTARACGRRDWLVFMSEAATVALRGYYGLDADLSIDQAATLLGCHRNTAFSYYKAGTYFPGAYKTSTRRIRIPMKEVLSLKERTRAIKEEEALFTAQRDDYFARIRARRRAS